MFKQLVLKRGLCVSQRTSRICCTDPHNLLSFHFTPPAREPKQAGGDSSPPWSQYQPARYFAWIFSPTYTCLLCNLFVCLSQNLYVHFPTSRLLGLFVGLGAQVAVSLVAYLLAFVHSLAFLHACPRDQVPLPWVNSFLTWYTAWREEMVEIK